LPCLCSFVAALQAGKDDLATAVAELGRLQRLLKNMVPRAELEKSRDEASARPALFSVTFAGGVC
jgi:hypothetical protein